MNLFKSSYYKVQKTLLSLCGAWPYQTNRYHLTLRIIFLNGVIIFMLVPQIKMLFEELQRDWKYFGDVELDLVIIKRYAKRGKLITVIYTCATGIKHLTINVPSMVRSGDTVMLSCNYDLEGASLYRVMWYFGQDEFYRYVLERSEPCITFPVDGIQVNLSKSNMYDVVLVDVSRKLTGPYKCEVSAGSPTYHTLIAIANMEVVDAPKTDPTIGIEKQRMTMGESLSANCSSGSSRPASNITWKLNGASISNGNKFRIRSNVIPDVNDTKITRSHVEFKVTNDMFDHGRIRLTCTASISSVYRKSVESEVLEDTTPLIASITGDASPHSHQSSGCGRCNLGTASGVILATTLSLTRLASLMTTMTLPVSSCRACR